MSIPCILSISEQTGEFSLDEMACYEEMKSGCFELLQQNAKDNTIPQPMFRCKGGCLEIFDSEEREWGDQTNVWGYDSREFLPGLAKHLKGEGKIVFSEDKEGWPPKAYEIRSGKVKRIL